MKSSIYLKKRIVATIKLNNKLKKIILNNAKLNERLAVLIWHGSLLMGEGYGDDYDIDYGFFLDLESHNGMLKYAKFINNTICIKINELINLEDERAEILKGTGNLLAIRCHWKYMRVEGINLIGLHIFRLSDVKVYIKIYNKLLNRDKNYLVFFNSIENFIRNYVIESKLLFSKTSILEQFKEKVKKFPEIIINFRKERVLALINTYLKNPNYVSMDILNKELIKYLYSRNKLFMGNPKRFKKDFTVFNSALKEEILEFVFNKHNKNLAKTIGRKLQQ